MEIDARLQRLVAWLVSNPTVIKTGTPSLGIGSRVYDDGGWWIKFHLNIGDPDAWTIIQVLGYALNDPNITAEFRTVFKPVSPPPYLNGGPDEYLSWVIEGEDYRYADRVADLLRDEFD
jgi:hypothetical protein